jgi:hypothetical protein
MREWLGPVSSKKWILINQWRIDYINWRIHPIPRCWTFRNWFRPGISSHQFLQIPGINYNSVRFRIASIFGIPPDSGIPNRNHTSALTLMHCDILEGYSTWTQPNSGQEFREFLAIPTDSGILDRHWIITRCRSHDRIILQIAIPESDGIPTDSGFNQFRNSCLTRFRNSRNWWNWFLGRNWFRNVQHCEIGWLLNAFTNYVPSSTM